MNANTDESVDAAEYIREQAAGDGDFRTAVILGSGLGNAGEMALNGGGTAIGYRDIPGMPESSVAGHAGRIVIGAAELSGILFLQGRVHHYEGHSLDVVTFAARMIAALGIRNLIVTNAAGGIRDTFRPGDLMLIDGHWSFLNLHVRGQEAGAAVRRELWSSRLRNVACRIDTPLNLHQGVFAMMSGPCYETPAEVRMLRTLGVDAVGMSTLPEAIVAARNGLEVLGISCITNIASGLSDAKLEHSEVSEVAAGINDEFTAWLFELLKSC